MGTGKKLTQQTDVSGRQAPPAEGKRHEERGIQSSFNNGGKGGEADQETWN